MTRGKKVTHEEFENKVYLKNPNIKLLGVYSKNSSKIEVKCIKCNFVWEVISSSLTRKRPCGCPNCAGNAKKDTEKFKNELSIKQLDVELLGEYINSCTKTLFRCKKCGHTWESTPNSILSGKGCPNCYNISKPKSHYQFAKEVEANNPNIELLEEYINNCTKIKVRSKICNHVWKCAPKHILAGSGCPKCVSHRYRTTKEYTEEVYKLNPNIEVIGEYINCYLKIEHKCLICNNIWDTTSSVILSGHGCPKCSYSKGEKIIQHFLENNNIKFESQYRIKECKNIITLPFDFGIFNDDKLKALIEYQGEQHFKPVDFSGKSYARAEKEFKKRILNDGIKRKYCSENNIQLIEIPYWIDNIEQYLKEHLDI